MAKKPNRLIDPNFGRPRPIVQKPGVVDPGFGRPVGAKPIMSDQEKLQIIRDRVSAAPVKPKLPNAVKPNPVKPKPSGGMQRPAKPSEAPKKGFRWHFRNGKWVQVKKPGYVEAEIEKQISQSAQMTKYQQKFNQSVYDQMAADAQRIAAAYKPSEFTGPDVLSGNRWADLYGRARGAESATQNLATLQSVGAARANLGRQQLEYARYLRSQRPYLQQQYQAQQDAQRLAQLQADIAAQYKQGQLQLGYDRLASQERQTAAKIQSGERKAAANIQSRLSKEQQKQLNDLRKNLFYWDTQTTVDGKKKRIWRSPKQQFRTSMEEILSLGYPPRVAAQIAAQWAFQSDKNLRRPATFRKGASYGFYQAMANRGVRPRYAEAITRQYFPGFTRKGMSMAQSAAQKALEITNPSNWANR